jgi:hypothetical protein
MVILPVEQELSTYTRFRDELAVAAGRRSTGVEGVAEAAPAGVAEAAPTAWLRQRRWS